MVASKEIILFHYTFSPYARRVVWYLNLRRIPYSQCLQPPAMPRPDLTSLSISYRRIPILSIGRDIYLDTRLILQKLDHLFPPSSSHPGITSTDPPSRFIERLLESWTVDGGVFNKAAMLIPGDLPLLRDPKFARDREDYTGRKWGKEERREERGEALGDVERWAGWLEGVLGDGRSWLTGGEGPGRVDIEAIWPFHWLRTLPNALPPDLISATQFPHLFAYISRFDATIRAAASSAGKPKTLNGAEARAHILASGFVEEGVQVDEKDPSGLKKGEEVLVFPTDSGVGHKDNGVLVGLGKGEVVIEKRGVEGGVRVHAPKHGFRVRRVGEVAGKL